MSTILFDIPVHLVKEYLVCPRIPFFLEVQKKKSVLPLWIIQGSYHHQEQEKLMNKRTLRRFDIEDTEVLYKVPLRSDSMHMHGIVDMLLIGEEYVYPVEFKLHGNRPTYFQIMQLVAYALLAEETYNKTCKTAFVMFEAKGKTFPVSIDEKKRQGLQKVLHDLRESFTGTLPDSSVPLTHCIQCRFLTFCNDRE